VGNAAVASWSVNRLDVLTVGPDHVLHHKAWDGNQWQPSEMGWESLGGTVSGNPAVASQGPNRLDAFVNGSDNKVRRKWWDGTRWAPPQTNFFTLRELARGMNVNN